MLSSIFYFTWLLIQAFVIINVASPFFLFLVQKIHQLTKKPMPVNEELYDEKDYAIIVSVDRYADQPDMLLSSLTQLNYTNYLVYVVVDKHHNRNMTVAHDKVVILQSPRLMYSAVRLQRYAVENFRRPHTHVVLLNSNSVVDKDYLNNLGACFHEGYQAVQSRQQVKNSKSIYDIVQSAGNSYSDFFKGWLPFATGASAVLACSGCAFTIRLYKQCLRKMTPADKDFITGLWSVILKSGHQVAFAHSAVVYNDNKTNLTVLMQQHASNINTWLRRFVFHGQIMAEGIMYGNRNQFLSGSLLLQMPVLTGFIASAFCLMINLWANPSMAMVWTVCLLLFPVCLMIAALHSTARYRSYETAGSEEDNTLVLQPVTLYEERNDDYDIVAQMV